MDSDKLLKLGILAALTYVGFILYKKNQVVKAPQSTMPVSDLSLQYISPTPAPETVSSETRQYMTA